MHVLCSWLTIALSVACVSSSLYNIILQRAWFCCPLGASRDGTHSSRVPGFVFPNQVAHSMLHSCVQRMECDSQDRHVLQKPRPFKIVAYPLEVLRRAGNDGSDVRQTPLRQVHPLVRARLHTSEVCSSLSKRSLLSAVQAGLCGKLLLSHTNARASFNAWRVCIPMEHKRHTPEFCRRYSGNQVPSPSTFTPSYACPAHPSY